MKRLLAAFAAALMLLSACSAPPPEPEPEPEGTGLTREDGMTVNLHIGGEPSSIDPAYATADDGGSYVLHLFEGLTALGEDGRAVPAAASEWTVEEDKNGLPIYTFTLREGLSWSDGTPVTAEDFAYAWLRALNPEAASPAAHQLYPIHNAQRYREGVPEAGEDGAFTTQFTVKPEEVGIEAVDETTLKVTLEGPCPDLPELMAMPVWCPVPKAAAEANPDTWTQSAATCVTNGRYLLKEWNHDKNLVLVENDQHRDAGKGPRLLNFVLSDDAQAVYNDFAAGRLQYASAIPTLEQEKEAQAGTLEQLPRAGVYYYVFNAAKAPFDDARVRRAISLAIDREALGEAGSGRSAAYGLVPDGIPDTATGREFSKFAPPLGGSAATNREEARKLLAEAGYPGGEGFPQLRFITNDAPAHLEAAEAVREMLAQVLGIDMAISGLSTQDFLTARGEDGWDMARGGFVGDRLDAAPYLEGWSAGAGANYGGFSSEEYDKLIAYARTAPEEKEDEAGEGASEADQTGDEEDAETELTLTRMETLHVIEKLLVLDEAAVVPLWQYREPALTAPGLTGVIASPLGYRLFQLAQWTPPAEEAEAPAA